MLDATRLRVLVAVARHGSVTAAAHALNYAQPSISHHMAKLEAETGAKLMERAGRGVRLTDAGRLLAGRAEEILGRLDAAEAELAAHVGLRQDRVRLAAFGSALATLVAAAAATMRSDRVATDVLLTQAEPTDALRMLRAGAIDVALTFRYLIDRADGDRTADADRNADAADRPAESGLRCQLVLDEPLYLITPKARTQPLAGISSLAAYSGHRWIAGCDQCRDNLVSLCGTAGFTANVAISTDDYVSAQAFVAAGLGVTILPELALRASRHPAVAVTELSGARRLVHAVTYGDPPAPPATTRLIEALKLAAGYESQ